MKRFTEEEVQSIKAVFNKYYDDSIFTEVSSELIKTNEEMGFNENWMIYWGHESHELVFVNRDMSGEYPMFTERFEEGTTVAEFCDWLDDYMKKHSYTQ
jgi:hypothetical protein